MLQVTKEEAIKWLQDAITDPEGVDAWGKTALFILEKGGKAGLANSQVEQAIKWVDDAMDHETLDDYDESENPGGLYAFWYLKSLLPGCDPKYPFVKVQLVRADGNTYGLITKVSRAMRTAGISPDEIGHFRDEAMKGDHDHLLQTIMAWVDTF